MILKEVVNITIINDTVNLVKIFNFNFNFSFNPKQKSEITPTLLPY